MTYFEDLTPYSYEDSGGGEVLNVGWLSNTQSYPEGGVPGQFLIALKEHAKSPVNVHRGVHFCELCPSFEEAQRVAFSDDPFIGSGEMRVMGEGHIVYAAPLMIVHYVESHDYLPPADFIRSVMQGG
ncbi:hypothetical protein [Streptomyces sp. NPDC059398]|uniref:DUF7919 family protein n=1 Tax=Streptomyces sp. NPDC059398 TaxID=3346820 RepID=UPI003674F0FD